MQRKWKDQRGWICFPWLRCHCDKGEKKEKVGYMADFPVTKNMVTESHSLLITVLRKSVKTLLLETNLFP